MGEYSKISWTDATFNPWWGCLEVSPACDWCYARELAKRFGFDIWGSDAPRRFFADKHWSEPLKWNRDAFATFGRQARVFCASMADVFEDRAELEPHRERLWDLIARTPNLRWNLLTKRHLGIDKYRHRLTPNAHCGVTVENQTYDFRIVPGVEWLSVEPMLGPLDLTSFFWRRLAIDEIPGYLLNDGVTEGKTVRKDRPRWIIIGGESGHHAREMKLEWATELIQQCREAGVAVHFKQTGDVLARQLGLKDRSGKDASEWPKELQIQQFPE